MGGNLIFCSGNEQRVNTIGSKANDIKITSCVVDIKSELENKGAGSKY